MSQNKVHGNCGKESLIWRTWIILFWLNALKETSWQPHILARVFPISASVRHHRVCQTLKARTFLPNRK